MPARRPSEAPFKPNLYVVARFLDALARPDEQLNRSELQAAVGVNYDVFRRYLAFLAGKGYVTAVAREAGSDTVLLTREGREVRAELRAWIARFLGGEDDPAAHPAPTRTRDDRCAGAPR